MSERVAKPVEEAGHAGPFQGFIERPNLRMMLHTEETVKPGDGSPGAFTDRSVPVPIASSKN